jgi:hypothetical protein
MTGTLTGTRVRSAPAGTDRNARERFRPFPQVDHENATGTHGNATHENGEHPLFRGGSRTGFAEVDHA